MPTAAYQHDLAGIHDRGFAAFVEGAAIEILARLESAEITAGRIVDLGCGSGILAERLVAHGYEVIGVDLSPAMIEIARRRCPAAEFHVQSLFDFAVPSCRAVTAIGEVFNYCFDERGTLDGLRTMFRKVYESLEPSGVLIFDIAEPGRSRGLQQAFREGPDWACLVEYHHDDATRRLTRRIVSFVQEGAFDEESGENSRPQTSDRYGIYRRAEETHVQQLYDARELTGVLQAIGFQVELDRRYGEFILPPNMATCFATK